MAIEQGVITRPGGEDNGPATAWVKIVRTGACESCSSRHSCHVGGAGPDDEVEALNPINARTGDRVQVSMSTSSLLKASFLLYVFPILCMILGGIVGNGISPSLGIRGPLLSVVMSLFFLIAALVIVRAKGRRMGIKNDYRPRISRVIGRDPGFAGQGQPAGAGGPSDCTPPAP